MHDNTEENERMFLKKLELFNFSDSCLKKVARTMERSFKRKTNLVARYWGEEFAIFPINLSVIVFEIFQPLFQVELNACQYQ